MSSEENNLEQQSGALNNSLCSQSCTMIPVCSKPGTIKFKLSASLAHCNCTTNQSQEFSKHTELTYNHNPPTCPIPDSVMSSVEICDCQEDGEDMTPPLLTCESEEEGIHDHKCCTTRCGHRHSSEGVQPTEPCPLCCSETYSSPLLPKLHKPHIEPRLRDHVPKSVAELKASLSGLTGLEKKLPPGNLIGCEYIDYRCQISTSLPCSPTDSKESFRSVPSNRMGFSLTIEPKDHRFCTNPNECKHSREFSPPPTCPPPPCPPPTCPPPPCPPPPCPPPPCPACENPTTQSPQLPSKLVYPPTPRKLPESDCPSPRCSSRPPSPKPHKPPYAGCCKHCSQ